MQLLTLSPTDGGGGGESQSCASFALSVMQREERAEMSRLKVPGHTGFSELFERAFFINALRPIPKVRKKLVDKQLGSLAQAVDLVRKELSKAECKDKQEKMKLDLSAHVCTHCSGLHDTHTCKVLGKPRAQLEERRPKQRPPCFNGWRPSWFKLSRLMRQTKTRQPALWSPLCKAHATRPRASAGRSGSTMAADAAAVGVDLAGRLAGSKAEAAAEVFAGVAGAVATTPTAPRASQRSSARDCSLNSLFLRTARWLQHVKAARTRARHRPTLSARARRSRDCIMASGSA